MNTQTKTTVKEVNWAYPTSSDAKRFGCYKTGCWVIKEGEPGKPLKAIAARATKGEAVAYALILSADWSFAWKYCQAHNL